MCGGGGGRGGGPRTRWRRNNVQTVHFVGVRVSCIRRRAHSNDIQKACNPLGWRMAGLWLTCVVRDVLRCAVLCWVCPVSVNAHAHNYMCALLCAGMGATR